MNKNNNITFITYLRTLLDVTQEIAPDFTQDVTQDITQDVTQDITRSTPSSLLHFQGKRRVQAVYEFLLNMRRVYMSSHEFLPSQVPDHSLLTIYYFLSTTHYSIFIHFLEAYA